jgi:RHS repeat-associated protein
MTLQRLRSVPSPLPHAPRHETFASPCGRQRGSKVRRPSRPSFSCDQRHAVEGRHPRQASERQFRRVRRGRSASRAHHARRLDVDPVLRRDDATCGATVREYIYLPEAEIVPTRQARTQVDRPVAVVDAVNTATPVTLMVHVDHLNRPVRMTNSAKASVWDVIYTPWGAFHSATGAQTLNTRFPGQWFQLESGLHYNWHRHYDPTLGRYTQPDPLGFVDGPSVYAYAKLSPLRLIDKDGRASSTQSHPPGITIPDSIFIPGSPSNTKFVQQCIALYKTFTGSGGGGDDDDGCKKEIEDARRVCTEAYANDWVSDYPVGPFSKRGKEKWTIQDCMRGLISKRCGGNATD